MKIIDTIGVVLIVLGISMTVLTFLAARRPIAPFGNGSGVQSFTVHEPQSPRSEIAPRGAGGNPSASSGQVL